MRKTAEERFWRQVEKTDTCWLWRGCLDNKGYGRIGIGYKPFRTHRYSWILHFGKIPVGPGYHGTCVLHKCDNPPCVRPDHLFLGTAADNAADRNKKGRTSHDTGSPGESSGKSKLCSKQVLEIRALYSSGVHTYKELGTMFGISKRQVGTIVNFQNWKHIPPESLPEPLQPENPVLDIETRS